MTTRGEGERLCDNNFDADLLLFDTNSEVNGLMDLFKSGVDLILSVLSVFPAFLGPRHLYLVFEQFGQTLS